MPPRFSLVPLVAAAAALMVLFTASATRAGDQHIRMVTVSPDKGATVSGNIRWEVQAVDGTPSRVDFQTDGEAVRWSERIVPYVFNGDTGTFDTRVLSNGSHTLTATAYSSNDRSSETSVTVTVANSATTPAPPAPPPVQLSVATTITDGATLSGSVVWKADPSSAVSEVQFLIDGAKKWVERITPYQYNGDPSGVLDTTKLADGSHTLTANAIAADGTTASTTRSVTVQNVAPSTPPPPPSVQLSVATTVAEGATLSGKTTWTASPSSAVSEVSFSIDGAKRWVERVTPYQYNGDPSGVLDTTTLANGSHTLTATAVAADGTTASATRSVTVQNTAPTQSYLPGSVYFTGDWETGDISQWSWGAQCLNYGTASDYITRGSLHLVSDVVGQGSTAGRFDLPASSQSNACEVLRKRTLNLGADEYYGMMFRLPTNWQEPSPAGWGLVLAQLNFQNIWGAPIIVAAHANHVSLVTQTGYCSEVSSVRPGCRYSSGPGGNLPQMHAISSLSPGAWHELVIHVRWAADASGVVEVWHRLKGQSGWTKTVSFSGYPTVQWSDDQPVNPNQTTSDKFGAYRGAANFPLSVWQDGVVLGTSFDAVSSRLP